MSDPTDPRTWDAARWREEADSSAHLSLPGGAAYQAACEVAADALERAETAEFAQEEGAAALAVQLVEWKQRAEKAEALLAEHRARLLCPNCGRRSFLPSRFSDSE